MGNCIKIKKQSETDTKTQKQNYQTIQKKDVTNKNVFVEIPLDSDN